MQVHRVDQTLLPPSCIASLACVCMMAACPLLIGNKKETRKNKSRRFTSVQMFHTHTHAHTRTLDKNWIISVIRKELNPFDA